MLVPPLLERAEDDRELSPHVRQLIFVAGPRTSFVVRRTVWVFGGGRTATLGLPTTQPG
jgi:hypothetical protein